MSNFILSKGKGQILNTVRMGACCSKTIETAAAGDLVPACNKLNSLMMQLDELRIDGDKVDDSNIDVGMARYIKDLYVNTDYQRYFPLITTNILAARPNTKVVYIALVLGCAPMNQTFDMLNDKMECIMPLTEMILDYTYNNDELKEARLVKKFWTKTVCNNNIQDSKPSKTSKTAFMTEEDLQDSKMFCDKLDAFFKLKSFINFYHERENGDRLFVKLFSKKIKQLQLLNTRYQLLDQYMNDDTTRLPCQIRRFWDIDPSTCLSATLECGPRVLMTTKFL